MLYFNNSGLRRIILFFFIFIVTLISGMTSCSIHSDDENMVDYVSEDTFKPDYKGFLDIYIVPRNAAKEERFKIYLDENKAYAFLPSYVDINSLQIEYDEKDYIVSFEDKIVKTRTPVCTLEEKKEYSISIQFDRAKGNEYGFGLLDSDASSISYTYIFVLMRSSNLPTIYISTESGTMEHINNDKTYVEKGAVFCYGEDGALEINEIIEKIHGRGHGSWQADQKGYNFKTTRNVNILGMGAAKKWRMIANAYDVTKERNALALSFAIDMELPYAVNYRFVDVYFNGQYGGNYMLCESIEVKHNRIEIDDDDFLIEFNTADIKPDETYFYQSNDIHWEVLNPQNASEEEINKTKDAIDMFISLLPDCKDDEVYNKICELIDERSFAKQYIINAITNETDTNAISMFYYIHDSKIYAGPAWDFDRGFGNMVGDTGRLYNWNAYISGPSEMLMNNTRFCRLVKDEMSNHKDALIRVLKNINDYSEQIMKSREMSRVLFKEISTEWGYCDLGDDILNIEYLYQITRKRIELMCDTLENPDKYHKLFVKSSGKYWEAGGG